MEAEQKLGVQKGTHSATRTTHFSGTRGLKKVWVVISDTHRGIQAAVRKQFLGTSWQRCKVHLMRNILARVQQRDKKGFAEKLKQIWVQPDRKSAVRTAKIFMAEYRSKYPEAVSVLAEGLEDSLQFYAFPEFDHRKIASTVNGKGISIYQRAGENVSGGAPAQPGGGGVSQR